MKTDTSPPSSARAWTFVAWTFGLGWGAAVVLRLVAGPMGGPLDRAPADPADWAATTLSLLFFLLPAIVALAFAIRSGISVKTWGLRMPDLNVLLAAPLAALAIAALATAAPIVVGISEYEPSGMGEVQRLAEAWQVEALELQLELQDEPRPLGSVIVRGIVVGLIGGLLLGTILELPWRGLVFTELSGRGFAYSALVAAGLAGLWGLPLQLLVGVVGSYGTAAATVAVFSYGVLGVPLAWLRARTGSILPGAVLAVTLTALGDLTRLATAGGSHLQLELCSLAVIGLLAGAALLRPPKVLEEAGEKTSET